jgi:ferredoxin
MDCPEVFDFDDQGFGFVKPDTEEIADAHREAVMRAVDGCPELAITAEDQ